MHSSNNSENNTEPVQARALTLPMLTVSILFFMGLWGCLAIYNATSFSNTPFHYAGRQLLWLIIGIGALWGTSQINFEKYEKYLWSIASLLYLSLLIVLFTGLRINGMRGWFDLGFCLIQPSELAKPIYILSLCSILKKQPSPLKLFTRMIALTIIWCIPLALQPDFGTMLVYVCGFLAVYILANGRLIYLLPLSLGAAPLAYFIYRTKPYIIARFSAFFNPESDPTGAGWHILQFQYTIARGGFSGQSWGNAFWSNAYLPLSYSDSSFASLVEAIGFAGTFPVIIGFVALAFAGYRLSSKIEDPARKIFIFAMPVLITSQALTHMSVNVGLLPPTGITLPMFSYGGSSLLSIMISFGMILSAAKKQQRL